MDTELSRRRILEAAGVGAAKMSLGAFGFDVGSFGLDLPMQGTRCERGAYDSFLLGY